MVVIESENLGITWSVQTGRKGHVGGESGWKWESPKTGGILSKPIQNSNQRFFLVKTINVGLESVNSCHTSRRSR